MSAQTFDKYDLSYKYRKCRVHDQSTEDICSTSSAKWNFVKVTSAAKCAKLCSQFDGSFQTGIPTKVEVGGAFVIGPLYNTSYPKPLLPDVSVFLPSNVCVSFNFKPFSEICELFDARRRYDIIHAGESCVFYQRQRNSKTSCWIAEYENCDEIQTPDSGVYWILTSRLYFVMYCEVSSNDTIYTVLQKRMNGTESFFKNWKSYMDGFGNIWQEFWLGNRVVNNLTSNGNYTLRIELEDINNVTSYAEYSYFILKPAKEKYKISFEDYSGNAGDHLRPHKDMEFSTFDDDNDQSQINCADISTSGWWYNDCKQCDLNAPFCAKINCARWGVRQYPRLKSVKMMMYRNG